jgi:hypothetical protein
MMGKAFEIVNGEGEQVGTVMVYDDESADFYVRPDFPLNESAKKKLVKKLLKFVR